MGQSPITFLMFARKPIDAVLAQGERGHLARTLGPLAITAIGVGCIIGAGIFVLTGNAAARYAGPGIMLSFIGGGIACGFVGLCYAELAAMIPVTGSAYTFTHVALGEFAAWLVGWNLILEYAAGAATVAVGWSSYAAALLHGIGLDLPHAWSNPAIGPNPGLFNIPAAGVVLILTGVLIAGTQTSATLNTAMVALKLCVVLAFIGVGSTYVHPARWLPLIPPNKGHFGQYGWSGLLRGAGVVFYAYIGFDSISTAAQEARKPQRDMPVGILTSLVLCTILYVAVAGVLTGIVDYHKLDVADPISRATQQFGLPWFSSLITLGALIGLTTVMLVSLFGQSRIFLAMAEDGLLPPFFSHVHPRLKTPYRSQALVGILIAIAAGLLPITILGQMVSIGTLLAFGAVCASTIRLRRVEPNRDRPFRVPAMPWVPLLGILSCLLLMVGLPLATWLRLAVWLALGLLLYAFYGSRK